MKEKILIAALEDKKKIVREVAEKMKTMKTLLIASTKGLPSSQFHLIKKNLRGRAEIAIIKKSLVLRALKESGKGVLQNLKEHINADIALFFSDIDAFSLAGLLMDNQSPTKARAGDIAPEDIRVEPGPTDLVPGPAISELSGVGLKVAVENGKITIKQGAVIAKAGEKIKDNALGVMSKLNIKPMKVGFIPLVAYDSESDKIYAGIKIDKAEALEELKNAIGKAFGFSIGRGYVCKENIGYFIAKAGVEEMAMEKIVNAKKENTNAKEETH